MTAVPPEELAARQKQHQEYKDAQRANQIRDEIRGIRTAINILIGCEGALKLELAKLQPPRKERSE